MKYSQLPIVLILVCALLGCESLVDLNGSDNLDPGTLHAEDLTVGDVLYTWCNGWKGQKPGAEKLTVDVIFAEENAYGPATTEQKDMIEDAGGEVLHEYNVPVLRAALAAEAISGLVNRRQGEAPSVDHVRSVPDAERQDMVLIVRYAEAVSDEDKEQIAELGGEVRRVFESINTLSVELPDQSVPALRSQPQVSAIGLNKAFCSGTSR